MDEQKSGPISDRVIEFLPPEDRGCRGSATRTCLCCRQPRPESVMDDDGCGICEECLSP